MQQSNLPSPSFIPLCMCNSQIYYPRVSYLSVQQSNLPSLSFIPLYAAVKSTIPGFHTSLCNSQSTIPKSHTSLHVQQSNLPSPSFIPVCVCNSQIYHPDFNSSLCNSQIYVPLCATVKSYYKISERSVCSIMLPY